VKAISTIGVATAAFLLLGCTPTEETATPTAGSTDAGGGTVFKSNYDTRKALALKAFWEPVPDDGVELGMGWDSREGRVVPNRCVKLSPVHSPGQTTMMTLDEVTSRSDVSEALKVSAAASVKSMFASGSASASFAKSTSVSSHSTTLLMKATVTNGVLFAGPADAAAEARTAFPAASDGGVLYAPANDSGRLTFYPWAQDLLGKPEEFRAHCGDGFVSAISSGARLLASFEIGGSSAAARQVTAAKVKGSYGPANFSGSANASKSEQTSMENVSVRYLQVGGAKGAIPTTKQALDNKLARLATEAFESPRFQDMRVTPYAQMAEVRFDASWADTDEEYNLIADTYWQLVALEQDLALVLDDYASFDERTGLTEEELTALADDVLNTRRAIFSALADPEGYFAQHTLRAPQTELSLFPQAANLKGMAPDAALDLSVLSESRDIGELARRLSKAFPLGNPTLLLVNLPLPDETGVDEAIIEAQEVLDGIPGGARLLALIKAELSSPEATEEDLQRAVVDRYIAPIARRACERDPTDRDCMTRGELADIARMVPVRLPAG